MIESVFSVLDRLYAGDLTDEEISNLKGRMDSRLQTGNIDSPTHRCIMAAIDSFLEGEK